MKKPRCVAAPGLDSPLVFYLYIWVIAAQVYMFLFGFIYLFVISR